MQPELTISTANNQTAAKKPLFIFIGHLFSDKTYNEREYTASYLG